MNRYLLNEMIVWKNAIRTSMSKFRKENWLTNIPLYGIFEAISK